MAFFARIENVKTHRTRSRESDPPGVENVKAELIWGTQSFGSVDPESEKGAFLFAESSRQWWTIQMLTKQFTRNTRGKVCEFTLLGFNVKSYAEANEENAKLSKMMAREHALMRKQRIIKDMTAQKVAAESRRMEGGIDATRLMKDYNADIRLVQIDDDQATLRK